MCWQERGMWTFQSVCAAGGDGVTWDGHLGKQSAGYEKVKHIFALSSGHSTLRNYTSEIDIQVHTKTMHVNAYKALEIQTQDSLAHSFIHSIWGLILYSLAQAVICKLTM